MVSPLHRFLRSGIMGMTNTPVTLPSTIVDELRTRARLLSGSEVMSIIGVSRNALCRWARTGVIPALRIGKNYKFDPAALATWIAARQM
jgi:excisionase family DNA binding protein